MSTVPSSVNCRTEKIEKHRRQAPSRTTCEVILTVLPEGRRLAPALGLGSWTTNEERELHQHPSDPLPVTYLTDSAPPLYDSRGRQTLSPLLSLSGFCYNRKSS